ncbi:MAG: hypothetical protein R3D67_05500 [Hyphomicrobiaceae bacterium]
MQDKPQGGQSPLASAPPAANGGAPQRHSALDGFAIGLLLTMCLCLAIGQVAIKVANAGISPLLQAGMRSAAAALVLGIIAEFRGIKLFARDGTFWPGLLTSILFA